MIYYGTDRNGNSLNHYGVKGMRKGERRWQNEDGSLTPAGYAHYGIDPNSKRGAANEYQVARYKAMTDAQKSKAKLNAQKQKIKQQADLERYRNKLALKTQRDIYNEARREKKQERSDVRKNVFKYVNKAVLTAGTVALGYSFIKNYNLNQQHLRDMEKQRLVGNQQAFNTWLESRRDLKVAKINKSKDLEVARINGSKDVSVAKINKSKDVKVASLNRNKNATKSPKTPQKDQTTKNKPTPTGSPKTPQKDQTTKNKSIPTESKPQVSEKDQATKNKPTPTEQKPPVSDRVNEMAERASQKKVEEIKSEYNDMIKRIESDYENFEISEEDKKYQLSFAEQLTEIRLSELKDKLNMGSKPLDLMHSGVKGQKWGVRRWRNEDGTLTPEGRIHYGLKPEYASKSDADLQAELAYKRNQNSYIENQTRDVIKRQKDISSLIQTASSTTKKGLEFSGSMLSEKYDKSISELRSASDNNKALAKTETNQKKKAILNDLSNAQSEQANALDAMKKDTKTSIDGAKKVSDIVNNGSGKISEFMTSRDKSKAIAEARKNIGELSQDELRNIVNRMNLERQYEELVNPPKQSRIELAREWLGVTGMILGTGLTILQIKNALKGKNE